MNYSKAILFCSFIPLLSSGLLKFAARDKNNLECFENLLKSKKDGIIMKTTIFSQPPRSVCKLRIYVFFAWRKSQTNETMHFDIVCVQFSAWKLYGENVGEFYDENSSVIKNVATHTQGQDVSEREDVSYAFKKKLFWISSFVSLHILFCRVCVFSFLTRMFAHTCLIQGFHLILF